MSNQPLLSKKLELATTAPGDNTTTINNQNIILHSFFTKEFLPLNTFQYLHHDVKILLAIKCLRVFSYSFLLMITHCTKLSFLPSLSTFFFSCLLFMNGWFSIYQKAYSEVFGRKRTLQLSCLLNALISFICACNIYFYPIFMVQTFALVSPSSNEIGPYSSIEASILGQLISKDNILKFVSWYKIFGTLFASLGVLCSGSLLILLTPFSSIMNYYILMIIYAIFQFILCFTYSYLSTDSELSKELALVRDINLLEAITSLKKSKPILLYILDFYLTDSYASSYILLCFILIWIQSCYIVNIITLTIFLAILLILAGLSDTCDDTICEKFGLIRSTIVFQIPANILIIILPYIKNNIYISVFVLIIRYAISQFDTPIRSAFMLLAVPPPERSPINLIINSSRVFVATIGPYFAYLLYFYLDISLVSAFIIAGISKIIYDIVLIHEFMGAKHFLDQEQNKGMVVHHSG